MTIQRSTFEFLLVAIILGSIMAATLHLGYGAGVLLMVFWAIVIYVVLRRKKRQASNESATESDKSIASTRTQERDHNSGAGDHGGDGGD